MKQQIILEPSGNFWTLHPSFKVGKPFKTIYESDKTKSKKASSDFMWFIALCYYQTSAWYKLDRDEKHSIVGEDYCGNANYYKEQKIGDIEECIEAFIECTYSEVEKTLHEHIEKLKERSKFIKKTEFSFDTYIEDENGKVTKIPGTAKQLDDMMANTKKLYDDYQRILKDLKAEEGQGTGKGGYTPSLSDSGDI